MTAPEIYEDEDTPSDIKCPTPAQQAEAARADAFRAAPFEWRSTPLHPFTPSREDLWGFLREHAGHPPLTDIYNGPGRMFRADAVIILWLCSHQPAEWRRYLRDHSAWMEAITTWGDDEKNVGRDLDLDAVTMAYRIFNRAHSTRAIHDDTSPATSTSDRLGE